MTAGYLLDTNIISYWFDETNNTERPFVLGRINSLPPSAALVTSAVVIGELGAGCRVAPIDRQAALSELPGFVQMQVPRVLDVGLSTAAVYGDLKARLFFRFAEKTGRKRMATEQLGRPIRPKALGADDNDLWIAAQALDGNFILVTHDSMDHIRQVATNLRVEDWALPQTVG